MMQALSSYLFYYFTISSLIRFSLIIFLSNYGIKSYREKYSRIVINSGIIIDLINIFCILILNQYLPSNTGIENYFYSGINLNIIWNRNSIAFFCYSIAVMSFVARFSSYYLHRDLYFFKFFSLLYILELAICFLLLTSSSNGIFIGWELLGLTSVLLIAFYETRIAALKNALTILVIYKISDIILYSSIIYSQYLGYSLYTDISIPWLMVLFLFSCTLKSSLFPWIWLPRAMEGPTPSSAMFYGGLATHIPVFIFLNLSISHPINNNYLIFFLSILILISSVISSLMSRMAPDAKSTIAYSSTAQIGVIYIEILCGFYLLALVHSLMNGVYRTIEFLNSPSQIYNNNKITNFSYKSKKQHNKFNFISKFKKTLFNFAYHEFVIPRKLITIIQKFLGLHSFKANKRVFKNYIIVSFSLFILINILCIYIFNIIGNISDYTLLLCALILNIISVLYKYKNLKFFIALLGSTFAVFASLANHLYFTIHYSYFIFIFLIIYFLIDINFFLKSEENERNFAGIKFKSYSLNILIFFIGISIIGVPGLSSYIIWENFIHELHGSYPNLLIVGFYIISLNTIAFFKFYFINFLGYKNIHKFYEKALIS